MGDVALIFFICYCQLQMTLVILQAQKLELCHFINGKNAFRQLPNPSLH